MKIKEIHADVWISLVLIAVSVFFYILAGQFFNQQAAVWPKMILIVILILSAMLLLQGFRLTSRHAEPGMIPLSVLTGPMASIIIIIVYAVLMQFTGYFVSSAIFLPFGMFALGNRNWKAIFGVTAGLELFVYVLFVMQLQLRMP